MHLKSRIYLLYHWKFRIAYIWTFKTYFKDCFNKQFQVKHSVRGYAIILPQERRSCWPARQPNPCFRKSGDKSALGCCPKSTELSSRPLQMTLKVGQFWAQVGFSLWAYASSSRRQVELQLDMCEGRKQVIFLTSWFFLCLQESHMTLVAHSDLRLILNYKSKLSILWNLQQSKINQQSNYQAKQCILMLMFSTFAF